MNHTEFIKKITEFHMKSCDFCITKDFTFLYWFATKNRAKNQAKACVYGFCADFFHTVLGAN